MNKSESKIDQLFSQPNVYQGLNDRTPMSDDCDSLVASPQSSSRIH